MFKFLGFVTQVLQVFTDLTHPPLHHDEIKELPGLTQKPTFKQYAGYLDANPGAHYFYWFMESKGNPCKDPLIVFLGAGPGASAFISLFSKMGTFTAVGGGSIKLNNVSINDLGNILILDGPAGVGFSYSDDGNLVHNDDQTAINHFKALKHFFQKFPKFKNNDLYLGGGSYGGIYALTLTTEIMKDSSIKLKGVGLSNAYLDRVRADNANMYYLLSHGLINQRQFDKVASVCCSTTGNYQTKCTLDPTVKPISQECKKAQAEMESRLVGIDVNNIHNTKPTDFMPIILYANSPEVKNALHIPPQISFNLANPKVTQSYGRLYSNMKSQVNALLRNNKTVFIFNGDMDSKCDLIMAQWFVDDLQLKVVTENRPWKSNGNVAGMVTKYEKLTIATVFGGGHNSMEDAPAGVYTLFKSMIGKEQL